jgi:hypothetical protein
MFTRRRRHPRVPLVARLSSGGTVPGTLVPAGILVALGVAYLARGNHPAAPMTASHLLPPWLGMVSSVAALVIGFVPPLLMDRLRKPGWKAAQTG